MQYKPSILIGINGKADTFQLYILVLTLFSFIKNKGSFTK